MVSIGIMVAAVVAAGIAALVACATRVGIPSDTEKRLATQGVSPKPHDLTKVTPELKAALQAFKEQYEVYWKKVLKQQHMGGDVGQPCAQPDTLLRKAIVQAFQEGLKLADVQRFLEGVVEWQEMPERLFDDDQRATGPRVRGLETGQLESADEDKLPVVLHSQLQAASGNTVTVLQNTFITDYQNHYVRNRLTPYVVVALPDSIECGILTSDFTTPAYGTEGPFLQFVVPEIVEADYPVPGVAVLDTPWAMGSFLHLYAFAFDLESRSWKHVGTKEWSPGPRWEYVRAEGVLLMGDKHDDRFDVRAFVREGVEKMKRGEIP